MPIDAEAIQNLGWRQGSVFTLQASTPVVVANRARISVSQFTIPDEARLILVSHDCDIVHPGPHEPRIEVCPAVRFNGALSGNFTGTRNPRRLHIELEIEGARHGYELRAPTRFPLPREILQDSAPDQNARITAKHHRYFCHWLAKRVRRTALPTAFDQRVSAQVRSAIRDLLHPLADSIESILIALDPRDEELAPDQSYVVQIVALMEAADFADQHRREAVEGAMQALENLLDHCGGIEFDACVCQSMSEMTLDVFRDFSIWDYDELSLDAGAQLPQQIP
jgi:hypothetical protein